jgi:VWFA-related protein
MTVRHPPVSPGWIAVLCAGLTLVAPQVPTFHSSTSMVSIDVSVWTGNVPVAGLTSADFTVTDNGVTQQIESVSLASVPVDVSLVVDLSSSTAGQLNQYRSDVAAIANLLRPSDRLRIVAFDAEATEIAALQPAGARPPVERFETGGSSSVYDGIAAALLRRTDLDRRHLIVAFSDGGDNTSILTGDLLLAAAKHTEAVLHLVSPDGRVPVIEEPDATPLPRALMPRSSPMSATDMAGASGKPVAAPLLQQVVETTGGSLHLGSAMVSDFKKIFADFTSSYVLHFQPAGVAPTGWHELTVTVARKGKFTVHARRGYSAG